MSDEDLIYPSDGSGEEVYDYGSDAEMNEGSDSEDAGSKSGSGSDSDSDSTSSSSSSSSGSKEEDLPLDIKLENIFYLAEDKFSEKNYADALDDFGKIVALETEHAAAVAKHRNKWSFKSLQKMCESLLRLERFEEVEGTYSKLLGLMNESYVTANDRDQALDAVLTRLGKSESCDRDLVARVYDMTLDRLNAINRRLWFKFSYNLAEIFLAAGTFDRVEELMHDLWAYTRLPDGTEDPSKKASTFKMLALNINFCQAAGRFSEVKPLYERTIQADMLSTVTDIRITGRLRENGGMMYMRLREWTNAYNDFFKAFSSYNENGKSKDAVRCLRRMVICNILSGSEVNPFDAQELMAYVDQSIEVEAVQRLRIAYQSDDIGHFEFTIMHPVNRISTDSFLREFVDELRFAIQSRVLLQTLMPFTRVSLDYMAKTLAITPSEVEALVVKLRLAEHKGNPANTSTPSPGGGQYRFRVDAVNKCIVNPPAGDDQVKRHAALLQRYTTAVQTLQSSFQARLGLL